MSSINFSIPEDLRDFVNERVQQAGFSTPSEYMRHLIREDRKQATQERLEEMLLEGLDSGPLEPWTADDLAELRAAVRKRLKARRRGHGKTSKA